ncbi:MAG TPA: TerC family protein [Opitutaceae bacterium]|nr:TerC family protein [Opitutaceae bacterium]
MILAAAIAEPHTFAQWVVATLQIVVIDVVLAGDNAVVIALAVRQLPPRQRMLGILLGSGMAVCLRVLLTYFAAQLLAVSYVQLVGGVLVVWIALKLLRDNTAESDEPHVKTATTLWSAAWLILVADVTMSIDNVLAVAGASKGSQWLLLFGLGLSIPLVVFTSNLLSKLMDRYAIIVWAGAGILGWVGAEMIATDRLFFVPPAHPGTLALRGAGLAGAAFVIAIGWIKRKRPPGAPPRSAPDN